MGRYSWSGCKVTIFFVPIWYKLVALFCRPLSYKSDAAVAIKVAEQKG